MDPSAGPERLSRERADADRQYNDALTRLDAALLRLPDLPHLNAAPPDPAATVSLGERSRILPDAPPIPAAGPRARFGRFVWRLVAPVFDRQQRFNEAVVEALSTQLARERESREALASAVASFRDHAAALVAFQSKLIQFAQQITPYVDTKDRAIAATVLRDPHEQTRALESALGMLRQQVAVLQRELQRVVTSGASGPREDSESSTVAAEARGSLEPPQSAKARSGQRRGWGPGARDEGGAPPELRNADASREPASRLTAYKYLGFEDEFRGTPDAIRARMSAYVPLFDGASDVLDVGCGRGEFLELLRGRGISARGLELNHEMVEVSRARGLEVAEGDAVGYLEGLADGALGGLFASQVVEHLEADYLLRFLELAFLKLRPGSTIVLETINVDSWSAFFGPYLRDITHAHPLPPDTLGFLLRASGFQRVETRASSPMPDSARLARLPLAAADALGADAAPLVEAFNRNADHLNALLFGFTDYAAIGEKL